MRVQGKTLAICFILFILGQTFFLINIQFPRTYCFDEFHYVPAAKQFLSLKNYENLEHPPLGKEIMAVGIALAGDKPLGWRVMSTFFGALTLVGMFCLGMAVFRNKKTALWVAFFSFFNQLLYVQARIGMLDTFMFAFMVWGLASFCSAWTEKVNRRQALNQLSLAGIFFGLAAACKWMGIVALVSCLGLALMVWIFQGWGLVFSQPSKWKNRYSDFEDFYSPSLWKGIPLREYLIRLAVLPILIYFITFIPYLYLHHLPKYSLWDLVLMQHQMWEEQQRVTHSHPYMSNWSGWPLLVRPIWYAFDNEPSPNGSMVRGVLLLGNPLLMWGGILTLLGCLYGWIIRRSREGFLILALYLSLYLSWALIPRHVSFYYYYYPAAMILSLSWAFVFHHWNTIEFRRTQVKMGWLQWIVAGATVALFIYFFPILSALRIQGEGFRRYMWFSSWI